MASAGWEGVGRGGGGKRLQGQQKLVATADTSSIQIPEVGAGLGQREGGMQNQSKFTMEFLLK